MRQRARVHDWSCRSGLFATPFLIPSCRHDSGVIVMFVDVISPCTVTLLTAAALHMHYVHSALNCWQSSTLLKVKLKTLYALSTINNFFHRDIKVTCCKHNKSIISVKTALTLLQVLNAKSGVISRHWIRMMGFSLRYICWYSKPPNIWKLEISQQVT